MTQGQIGYLLQQAIAGVDPDMATATLLTRARVAADDPAFDTPPTKPVGPFYDEEEARGLADERGWQVGPDSDRGWRCLVPSPRPVEVVEHEQIAELRGRASSWSPPAAGALRSSRATMGSRAWRR